VAGKALSRSAPMAKKAAQYAVSRKGKTDTNFCLMSLFIFDRKKCLNPDWFEVGAIGLLL
jgi:hypothetical protein